MSNERVGSYSLTKGQGGQPVTQDPLLLVNFAAETINKEPERFSPIIDIGTGTGIITLALAIKTKVEKIVGVEIDIKLHDHAVTNIKANDLDGSVEMIHCDYRDLSGLYPRGSFSTVISNPPYIKAGHGRISPDPVRAASRYEIYGGLEDLVETTDYLLSQTGTAFFVFTIDRYKEMILTLAESGLHPSRMRFVLTGKAQEKKIFLVEVTRKKGLIIEEDPLVLD